jgi:hypothetical protein
MQNHMESIIVTIRDGKAVIASKGFKGAACLRATLDIERALGKTTGDVPTAEMREQESILKVSS